MIETNLIKLKDNKRVKFKIRHHILEIFQLTKVKIKENINNVKNRDFSI